MLLVTHALSDIVEIRCIKMKSFFNSRVLMQSHGVSQIGTTNGVEPSDLPICLFIYFSFSKEPIERVYGFLLVLVTFLEVEVGHMRVIDDTTISKSCDQTHFIFLFNKIYHKNLKIHMGINPLLRMHCTP